MVNPLQSYVVILFAVVIFVIKKLSSSSCCQAVIVDPLSFAIISVIEHLIAQRSKRLIDPTLILRFGLWSAMANDTRIAASLLRMHFHDCISIGCDASILLHETSSFSSQKDALPNRNSSRGFELIESIKVKVEKTCPNIVSCIGMLTLALRSSILGGPCLAFHVWGKISSGITPMDCPSLYGISTNQYLFLEGNDDDESTFHGAHMRRGHAFQVQVFKPMNLREMFLMKTGSGCLNIFKHWDKCIARKFPDLLRRVRNEAKETMRKQGLEVGNVMFVLINFQPSWIRTDIWKQMIDIWNNLSGKQSLKETVILKAKILGRELQPHEMWKQSHCRKGSRPLDKDLSCSSSLVSDVDLEENIEEENLVWVDDRANETWDKYDGYLVEKYGDGRGKYPKFDKDLWSRAASGKNKGKVYELSSVNDSNTLGWKDLEVC
ncbi:hypothetical protein E3N88_07628 [Mikania micrantha]|uniref:peroxidase n=1 Tax=Mikania micrantha TaxID=192012 RepID=A0A5N6PT48_9ASTR|nr:hypothetical protein E3N88_07628 [Mikania micrantha]